MGKYKPNTIQSLPSNQSMTRDGAHKGNYVLRGLEPKAWRVKPGTFELITDPEDTLTDQQIQRAQALRVADNGTGLARVRTNGGDAARKEGVDAPFARRHRPRPCAEEHVEGLCSDFAACVEVGVRKYSGPSVYFHCKTMDRFKSLGYQVHSAIEDERFRELLYATLVSWGMHDMKGAKMPDFATFTEGLKACAPEIHRLSDYEIVNLREEDVDHVIDRLWPLITRLPGSVTKSKLVANSKLVHHLLPCLVPPIDRENSGKFFGYTQQDFQRDQAAILRSLFPRFVFIAKRMQPVLASFDYSGFNSSPTKVIDNAIIGYVQKNLKAKGRHPRKKGAA